MESWLSGLRRTTGNRVYVNSVPRVQIPNSPPEKKRILKQFKMRFFFYFSHPLRSGDQSVMKSRVQIANNSFCVLKSTGKYAIVKTIAESANGVFGKGRSAA